jgi:methionyl-tRNA synthetase
MVESYCGGAVPQAGTAGSAEDELRSGVSELGARVRSLIDGLEPNKALEEILERVRATNRYVESNAPWKLHKEGNQERINAVLYTAAEALRIASILLYPVMPGKCRELLARLGVEEKDISLNKASQWGLLQPGQKISAGEPLFPRIDTKTKDEGRKRMTEETKTPENAKQETVNAQPVSEELIDIDYFKKVKLRTAEIIMAEKVPNADKLLRLQVKLGQETRQVLAGIAQWYAPESLVGQQVVIVANLKPAKIRGLESHGMLLAAQDKDGVVILTPQRKVETGGEVR